MRSSVLSSIEKKEFHVRTNAMGGSVYRIIRFTRDQEIIEAEFNKKGPYAHY